MGHTQSSRKRSIGFKACEQEDEDLITWWEAMPKGARSNVLRTLIRAAMQIQAEASRVQHQHLDQLSDDTAWLKQALNDLPGYLETIIGRVATTRLVAPETQVITGEATPAQEVDGTTLDLRRSRLGKTTW